MFEKGQKVIIKGRWAEKISLSWNPRMDKCIGKEGIILGKSNYVGVDYYSVRIGEEVWGFVPSVLELVQVQSILDITL
jgi:hypothetical protein